MEAIKDLSMAREFRNPTQQLTANMLVASGLAGDSLLCEALLRRGYLCFRDPDGLWLGTGSHPHDLVVLGRISGITVASVNGHPSRMARIAGPTSSAECLDTALDIVAIPGNTGMTRCGLGGYVDHAWRGYRAMRWGAKLPVCPDGPVHAGRVNGALDTGIALLVKALPLMRVSSAWSCDGHGRAVANISLFFPWCVPWARAIVDAVGYRPLESGLSIKDSHIVFGPLSKAAYLDSMWTDAYPAGPPTEEEVRGMLNDIQRLARIFMNQRLIDVVGPARQKVIAECNGWGAPPDERSFYEVARPILSEALSDYGLPGMDQALQG